MGPRLESADSNARVESDLLGVLLFAETAREGAAALLRLLAPLFGDTPTALAVRDRDGVSLQVLAESGDPVEWPERLAPQFALGAEGVDQGSGYWVAPLRANGRIIGALLVADARHGAASYQDDGVRRALEIAGLVLHHLVDRMDAELQRRAAWLRSVDSVAEGMAHQIANPIASASAVAQLLVAEMDDDGHRAAVASIIDELERASAVVADMLSLHNDTCAQDGIIDLGPFVERVVGRRAYEMREAGIALDVCIDPGYMGIRADARGLEHALLTSLRAAELQSRRSVNRSIAVRVAARSSIGYEVQITDSGPGEVPLVEPAYFDMPLRPADHVPRETHEASPPPDLGLVRSILRGCGGYLEVGGSKADGTVLTMVFPRAAATLPRARAAGT